MSFYSYYSHSDSSSSEDLSSMASTSRSISPASSYGQTSPLSPRTHTELSLRGLQGATLSQSSLPSYRSRSPAIFDPEEDEEEVSDREDDYVFGGRKNRMDRQRDFTYRIKQSRFAAKDIDSWSQTQTPPSRSTIIPRMGSPTPSVSSVSSGKRPSVPYPYTAEAFAATRSPTSLSTPLDESRPSSPKPRRPSTFANFVTSRCSSPVLQDEVFEDDEEDEYEREEVVFPRRQPRGPDQISICTKNSNTSASQSSTQEPPSPNSKSKRLVREMQVLELSVRFGLHRAGQKLKNKKASS